MKLCRIGPIGHEKPALLDFAGTLRSLDGLVPDIGGAALAPASLARIAAADHGALPTIPGGPRFGACVSQPTKIVCIGLNYRDHAAESGLPVPAEPVIFLKGCLATGPNDQIPIPREATQTDWEVELGVVIGTEASYVSEANALSHVAGYCVVDDVSERAFQHERGGQWTKGKSARGFAPLGPWMVTADEVPDPQALLIWLKVNGVGKQNGNTSDMIFGVAEIISYVSRFMVLYPGDVIATGTPAGVGAGQKPAMQFLQAGDTVNLGISGLGEQTHRFVTEGMA
jgi:2-keto-4-pentenoate hydratase/2-oxohepta-3-ene-1,7-dioic acid hydratase in catechol pathway